jgi:hypothetical protein
MAQRKNTIIKPLNQNKMNMILVPPIDTMIKEVEQYIKLKTGRTVNIIFNNHFRMQEHIEMLRDAYKIIKKDESK